MMSKPAIQQAYTANEPASQQTDQPIFELITCTFLIKKSPSPIAQLLKPLRSTLVGGMDGFVLNYYFTYLKFDTQANIFRAAAISDPSI